MKKLATFSVALLTWGGAMALAPLVYAQEAPTTAKPPAATNHGMMGGDGQGMMNMMAQMNKMMENCNRMMQSHNDRQNQKDPAKKDGPG